MLNVLRQVIQKIMVAQQRLHLYEQQLAQQIQIALLFYEITSVLLQHELELPEEVLELSTSVVPAKHLEGQIDQ